MRLSRPLARARPKRQRNRRKRRTRRRERSRSMTNRFAMRSSVTSRITSRVTISVTRAESKWMMMMRGMRKRSGRNVTPNLAIILTALVDPCSMATRTKMIMVTTMGTLRRTTSWVVQAASRSALKRLPRTTTRRAICSTTTTLLTRRPTSSHTIATLHATTRIDICPTMVMRLLSGQLIGTRTTTSLFTIAKTTIVRVRSSIGQQRRQSATLTSSALRMSTSPAMTTSIRGTRTMVKRNGTKWTI